MSFPRARALPSAEPGVLHPWDGGQEPAGKLSTHLHSIAVNPDIDLEHLWGRVLSEPPISQPQDLKAGVRNWHQTRSISIPACSQTLCDIQKPTFIITSMRQVEVQGCAQIRSVGNVVIAWQSTKEMEDYSSSPYIRIKSTLCLSVQSKSKTSSETWLYLWPKCFMSQTQCSLFVSCRMVFDQCN